VQVRKGETSVVDEFNKVQYAAQLVASAGVPEVLKVRLGVRFPLATTHPV